MLQRQRPFASLAFVLLYHKRFLRDFQGIAKESRLIVKFALAPVKNDAIINFKILLEICQCLFHRFLENSLKKSMLKLRKNSFLSLGILCITIIESLGTICYHKEKWYFIINSLKCFEELILENKNSPERCF